MTIWEWWLQCCFWVQCWHPCHVILWPSFHPQQCFQFPARHFEWWFLKFETIWNDILTGGNGSSVCPLINPLIWWTIVPSSWICFLISKINNTHVHTQAFSIKLNQTMSNTFWNSDDVIFIWKDWNNEVTDPGAEMILNWLN